MSISFVCFGLILLLVTPFDVKLLVCIGFGGCGCPIYVSMFLRWKASFALMKNPLSSASGAEAMTAFVIYAMLRIAPLFGGISVLVDNKKCPPALLCAFGSLW